MPGPVERYVALYRRIAQRTATLVAHWLRVGYVQGNMNSDNTLLGGATIDYGPYGWMERYDPLFQPFTSDSRGNFAFVQQPSAMNLNVAVLGEEVAPVLVTSFLLSLVHRRLWGGCIIFAVVCLSTILLCCFPYYALQGKPPSPRSSSTCT
jgi:uncharacterized protein YdiU (UPF0061 family)